MKVMVKEGCRKSEKIKEWLKITGLQVYAMPMDVDSWPVIAKGMNITDTPALIDNNEKVHTKVDDIKNIVRSYAIECQNV